MLNNVVVVVVYRHAQKESHMKEHVTVNFFSPIRAMPRPLAQGILSVISCYANAPQDNAVTSPNGSEPDKE
jgi:hypothetical protein